MRTVLHILTQPADPLATAILARQQQEPDFTLQVVDLTRPEVDYSALVEAIFEADSVQVW